MKNKKFIALLAMTVALSGVMTACSFGGGKEDSVVVESTPTPTPAKKAKVTPTVAADAQNTTYTSKDKSVAIKLPDATWANKSDETDMVSFESPDQGRILILHGSGADLESAVIPNSQDMAVSMTQAENMVNGTDFEIQDYKADQKDGINIYSYTVKYKDTTKSDGYVYAINKFFVNDSEYYSLVASVKKEDALKKVQESVDSFAILGDSTLKSVANGSAAKTAGKVMQQLPLTEVHLQMVMQQLLLTEQQQMELQLPTEAHLQTEVQHLTEHLQTEAVHLMVLPMELHPLTAAPPVLS